MSSVEPDPLAIAIGLGFILGTAFGILLSLVI